MNNIAIPSKKRSQFGQSLTEVALTLPIILLIIAGLVEISNLIVSQSKLDAAVRKAVRFGAQGGVEEGMRTSLLQAITPTLDLDPNLWDVYVIRATVNASGNDYVAGTWTFEPIYGLQNARALGSIDQPTVQAEILANLRQQTSDNSLAANFELVGMMAFHSVDSILGLDNFLRGFNNVRAFAVMRVTQVATGRVTNGCQAYPIAVEAGARSINGPDDFPDVSDFEYPTDDEPVLGDYFYPTAIPAPRSMLTAAPGYLFVVPFNFATNGQPQPHPGTFDFMRWDWFGVIQMRPALADSLTYPGNTRASCANGAGGDPGWEHPILGCAVDNELHVGDPVRVNTANPTDMGNNNEIKEAMEENVVAGRAMRIMVFHYDDPPPPATGYGFSSEKQRKISNFVIVRPLGFNLVAGGEPEWMLFEFLGLDNSCGVDNGG